MNNPAYIHILVEGDTELRFVEKILEPYLQRKNVVASASKLGSGGGLLFKNFKSDIRCQLKKPGCHLSIMIDFYGTPKDNWPGMQAALQQTTPAQKATTIHTATAEEVNKLVSCHTAQTRFIPYVCMHEFESLLFSSPAILAQKLRVRESKIQTMLRNITPEELNNSRKTAPSKRLEKLKKNYIKTIDGIAIAEAIGIDTMRAACPLFNQWLTTIENLPSMS